MCVFACIGCTFRPRTTASVTHGVRQDQYKDAGQAEDTASSAAPPAAATTAGRVVNVAISSFCSSCLYQSLRRTYVYYQPINKSINLILTWPKQLQLLQGPQRGETVKRYSLPKDRGRNDGISAF